MKTVSGYPAYLKAGFRIFNSTSKYEINKDIRCIEAGRLSFPVLTVPVYRLAFIYISVVTVSRRNFWRFYEFIWPGISIFGYFQYQLSGRISGKANPVFGRTPDCIKGYLISGASLQI
jgi:hypothetical protein